jgi:hypothetical protein
MLPFCARYERAAAAALPTDEAKGSYLTFLSEISYKRAWSSFKHGKPLCLRAFQRNSSTCKTLKSSGIPGTLAKKIVDECYR